MSMDPSVSFDDLERVFSLFDTDCDGLISKDDLRFTYTALGNEPNEDLLEQMMEEARDPLDYDAFVQLMCRRTVELDPEEVLLEAWSKWDDYGTGKIDERNCLDTVEVFPYLSVPVIENTTLPAYTWCRNYTVQRTDPIYSWRGVLGLRLNFKQPLPAVAKDWPMLLNATYRFLKLAHFRTEGRLVPHSFCDFYFFAGTAEDVTTMNIWRYFHSPRFPANYPAHIKCAYKFIGHPDTHVELFFEELQLPPVASGGCQLDAVTIFDAESAHSESVIDVLCTPCPSRRIVSSGPDLLIEFNASSNRTAKGFRGKFRFVANDASTVPGVAVMEAALVNIEQPGKLIQSAQANSLLDKSAGAKTSGSGNEYCKQLFDSRVNKSGTFESNQLLGSFFNGASNKNSGSARIVQCRYEFKAQPPERIQIKFHDFNIPTESENSTACQPNDALQLLTQVRGKFDTQELICGAFLPKPLMSMGAEMHLQFVGKYPPSMTNKVQYYGFRAEYRFLTNFGIMSGSQLGNECNFVYNSSARISGLFHSPNFPGYYLENVVCNYYFYGGIDERIVLRFTYFDVEGIGTCDHQTASDYVEFSNFMSTDRKFSKYCGKLQNFEIRSDGRFFRVTLSSNDRFVAIGFRALYTFESITADLEDAVTDLDGVASMESYVSHGLNKMPKAYVVFVMSFLILILILN